MESDIIVNIKKMVPAMEGDIPKCHPEETLLTEDALGRGHHFLYRIESPARLIHPYARHDFRPWFGQKTAQMNHAPFSTFSTEQYDVAHMDDVGISQCIAIVAFNCTESTSEAKI
jgi:hypothetical protein